MTHCFGFIQSQFSNLRELVRPIHKLGMVQKLEDLGNRPAENRLIDLVAMGLVG
jgi:hypothetical protein